MAGQTRCDGSDEIRAITVAGIRPRHPGYSQEEVRTELAPIFLGPADAGVPYRG